MIKVEHLTKRYADAAVVHDISFDVEKGEIMGFLGPNGAGKTTTMRILSGFLPATSGSVKVAGFSVFHESMEVRKRIGYMPEQCPLYTELRVDEYLRYRAKLKGLRRRTCRKRLAEVKEMCGLRDVGCRIIGQLSKGFRQRVGLADSLLHEPDLLILDEPTIGLDPHQIRSVRALIKGLAPRHTVLLSTHILPEAEMICDRVMIINRGRLVASDSPSKLRGILHKKGVHIIAEIKAGVMELREMLSTLAGVVEVEAEPLKDHEWVHLRLACQSEEDVRPSIDRAAAEKGWPLRELKLDHKSLEDIFVSLTGDEEAPVR